MLFPQNWREGAFTSTYLQEYLEVNYY